MPAEDEQAMTSNSVTWEHKNLPRGKRRGSKSLDQGSPSCRCCFLTVRLGRRGGRGPFGGLNRVLCPHAARSLDGRHTQRTGAWSLTVAHTHVRMEEGGDPAWVEGKSHTPGSLAQVLG